MATDPKPDDILDDICKRLAEEVDKARWDTTTDPLEHGRLRREAFARALKEKLRGVHAAGQRMCEELARLDTMDGLWEKGIVKIEPMDDWLEALAELTDEQKLWLKQLFPDRTRPMPLRYVEALNSYLPPSKRATKAECVRIWNLADAAGAACIAMHKWGDANDGV